MKLTTQNVVVGFAGTGVMGKSMAANVMKAGYSIRVYNRTKAKAADLLEAGAVWAGTVEELASNCNVVITMLGYPQDVETVYFGEGGLLASARQGSYLLDMTTSSPGLAARITAAAAQKGLFALDAPVSGGDVGAREARLTIMVGGEETPFQDVLPILECMGKNIVLQGPAGSGQHTKMCNQIAIAANMMGVC